MAKSSSRPTVPRRSALAVLGTLARNGKALDTMWGVAAKAPVLRKVSSSKKTEAVGIGKKKKQKQKQNSKGPVPMRTMKIISSAGLRTLASGAGNVVAQIAEFEGKKLRTSPDPENKRGPYSPALSQSFQLYLEAFLRAYAAEVFYSAAEMKTTLRKHKKVTSRVVRIAAETVTQKLYSSRLPVDSRAFATHFQPTKAKKASSKKKEGAEPEHEGEGEEEYI